MIAIVLTVISAGVLGGAIAADVTVIVVLAGVALALIGIYTGVRLFADLCDLSKD